MKVETLISLYIYAHFSDIIIPAHMCQVQQLSYNKEYIYNQNVTVVIGPQQEIYTIINFIIIIPHTNIG